MENKLSLQEIKKLPPITLLRIINKAKASVKKDPAMIKAFKEYDVDIDELDYFPTYFKDLDVSAKTIGGIVYLSYKLLLHGFTIKDFSYLTHEYVHTLQQTTGNKPTKSSDGGNYLNNAYEQEAFKYQVDFISNKFDDEEAEEYVEDLLDYHEVDNKKEKEKLEDKLLAEI